MKDPKVLKNTKNLFAHLLVTLEQVSNKEISKEEALTVSKMHNTAQGLLNYELRKAKAMSDPKVKKEMKDIQVSE